MTRPRPPMVATRLVPRLFACLEEGGHESADLIARFGLPPDIASKTAVVVSSETIRSLGELIEHRTGDPSVGIRAAQRVERGSYGVLEFAARNAPDLRGAVERIVRYHRLINEVIAFATEHRTDGSLSVENRLLGDKAGFGRQGNEFTLAAVLLLLREALEDPVLAPLRVWFIHPRPPDTRELERWFGAVEVSFGRDSNGLLLGAEALERPIHTADQQLLPILDDHARLLLPYAAPSVDLLARTRAQLRQGLSGEPSLERTARALRMSARTLQRRLCDLGTSFNGVLDGVRAELALEYIQDPRLALGEVAYLLGYSDARAFLRAFKRWTGEPPQQYRRRILVDRPPPQGSLVEHLTKISYSGR